MFVTENVYMGGEMSILYLFGISMAIYTHTHAHTLCNESPIVSPIFQHVHVHVHVHVIVVRWRHVVYGIHEWRCYYRTRGRSPRVQFVSSRSCV